MGGLRARSEGIDAAHGCKNCVLVAVGILSEKGRILPNELGLEATMAGERETAKPGSG